MAGVLRCIAAAAIDWRGCVYQYQEYLLVLMSRFSKLKLTVKVVASLTVIHAPA